MKPTLKLFRNLLPFSEPPARKRAGEVRELLERSYAATPSIDVADPFVTLKRTGAILGTKGNDSLVLVQE